MIDKKDKKTVDGWFSRWHVVVRHALASRLRRPEDIEDLAQEVYLRLLRVPKPDLVRHPQSYLYRVALNVAEEWRHRAQQSLEHGSDALEALEASDGPEDDAMQAERDTSVRYALDRLPQNARVALVLHTHKGLTYEQIANHMNVSRRAVKRYVANGYVAMREMLPDFRNTESSRKRSDHVGK